MLPPATPGELLSSHRSEPRIEVSHAHGVLPLGVWGCGEDTALAPLAGELGRKLAHTSTEAEQMELVREYGKT